MTSKMKKAALTLALLSALASSGSVFGTEVSTTPLGTGEVSVFTFDGGVKIHNFNTKDVMEDNAFVVESKTGLVAVESLAFKKDFPFWGDYLKKLGKPLQAVLISNHPNNAAAWAGDAPVYVSEEAWKAMHSGSTKGIMTGLSKAYGPDFDTALPAAPKMLSLGEHVFEGVRIDVRTDGDGNEFLFPDLKAAYIHMMGSECHSIVGGAAHADALIGQLEALKKEGVTLLFTSHWQPEGVKAMDEKIAYLRALKATAANARSKDEFIAAMKKAYPKYQGEHYLDMTAGFFFPMKK